MRVPNSWIINIVPLMSTASVWSIDSSVVSRQDSCSDAADVVDQRVDSAQLLLGGARHPLDVLPADDVALHHERLGALAADAGGGALRPLAELR
jgi:hypothetical protein